MTNLRIGLHSSCQLITHFIFWFGYAASTTVTHVAPIGELQENLIPNLTEVDLYILKIYFQQFYEYIVRELIWLGRPSIFKAD